MTIEDQLVQHIIKEQELVIGPLAWEEAKKVSGLKVSAENNDVTIEGNPREVLERLVAQYERLFGPASREVCRDAVRPYISQVPAEEIPAILR